MTADRLVARLTKRQLEDYTPSSQPYYTFIDSKWQPTDPNTRTTAPATHATPSTPITALRLITWNIDFMSPQPQARMRAALSHLHDILVESTTPETTATIIMLQEMKQSAPLDLNNPLAHEWPPQVSHNLGQIASTGWVQDGFHVSDLTTHTWRCPYNSVTLVDRRLAIRDVARLPFVSEFEREALLVDVSAEDHGEGPAAVVRLCNVHLDSMAGRPPLRPIQWNGCAKFLQDEADGVVAGIIAGDCNANSRLDETLPQENGFKDAYLELGGSEGDPDGFTWGPQSKDTRYPHKRMDKICFCQGDEMDPQKAVLRVKKLEKVGVGVKVQDEEARRGLEEEGYFDFVTDHYGLMADFELGESWRLSTGS
ncbi:hypothetical protein M406DRAFT_251364 [Cryphonectria parasitica EP155]|uniref:Endonuclease/exonuclease/phosphatase domain-containing protein n=1 Tax=Cryphonectria parasitica (strain ATCC 38755 / EP155) TaxID=660469 RepID=A0A9P4Y8X6_CRYP1|nr:uncharacterized protein M406DRAFT_251364 [Cryphonectria parasitica EP155]KAF3769147.1 hypothetical protein M406DRAFT_251364 [Cryphonectria parasitica EP155]